MAEYRALERRKIVIVFVVLAFVCIAIVVVALILNRDVIFGKEETRDTFPESMHTREFEEINELAAGMAEEDAKKLYEEKIGVAITEENKAEARVEYGRYLLNNGEVGLAIEQFEEVDDRVLDDGYKILYYSALREYYLFNEDGETSEEYNKKIRIVIENSDYAAGG